MNHTVLLASTDDALPGLDLAVQSLGLPLRREGMLRIESLDPEPLCDALCATGPDAPAAIAVTSPRAATILARVASRHREAISSPGPRHREAISSPDPCHREAISSPDPCHREVISSPDPCHREAISSPDPCHREAISSPDPCHREVLAPASTVAISSPVSGIPVWSGSSGAELLRPHFRTVTVVAAREAGLANALADAMLQAGCTGPVLFPCGESHREELVVRLRAAGCRVLPVPVYRSVLVSPAQCAAALRRVEVVIATSPRIVSLLASAAPPGTRPVLVAIGPTTARTAVDHHWTPAAIAASPTVDGVMAALARITVQPASAS